MELRNQISQSGVQVDVDAPKGQDIALIMEEMRAKYEKMALKNQEELKAWHESQVYSKRQSFSCNQVLLNTVTCFGANVTFCLLSRSQRFRYKSHRTQKPSRVLVQKSTNFADKFRRWRSSWSHRGTW